MIMLAGIILGLFWGYRQGSKLGENRSDRVMYMASFTLAGFALGAIITLIIQLMI